MNLNSIPRERFAEIEAEFLQLAENSGAVQLIFDVLRNAMTGAQITVRAPDEDSPKGWNYEYAPDHPVRVVAARTLAQILRLMPAANVGANVTVTDNRTLNVTPGQRLAELESVGVGREEIAAACRDLLAASEAKPVPTDGKTT